MTRSMAYRLTRNLGGSWHGSYGLAPAPGHSRHDRSLKISPHPYNDSDVILHSFAGEDWRSVRDKLRAQGQLSHSLPAPKPANQKLALRDTQANLSRIAQAKRIWSEAGPLPGTIAERYLLSRALKAEGTEHALRFHPACPFAGQRPPALVAALRSIADDELVGVQRTALTIDGHKIDRRMLGRAAGAAIKLSPDDDVTQGLAIGEGMETALSLLQLGWKPVWAMGSATALANLPVLQGLEALGIMADADAAGEAAAETCAARWRQAGREAIIWRRRHGP